MTREKHQTDHPRIARNLIALVGFGLLLAGSFDFDWRAGCCVTGVLLFSIGVAGMAIAARVKPRR